MLYIVAVKFYSLSRKETSPRAVNIVKTMEERVPFGAGYTAGQDSQTIAAGKMRLYVLFEFLNRRVYRYVNERYGRLHIIQRLSIHPLITY
jgi:hypothetical protein